MEQPSKGPEKIDGYDKYELESCMDCLLRAEEIKSDKKKMAALMPMMEKKMKAMHKSMKSVSSLADLKSLRQSKAEEEMEGPDDSAEEESSES